MPSRPARKPTPRAPSRRGPAQRAAARPAPRAGRSADGKSGHNSTRAVQRWAILASVLVVLAILLVPTVRNYLHQRGEIDALREKVAAQRVNVTELQKEQERWKDNAYVEQQARERLKFVRPGDRSYTVIDASPSEDPLPGVAVAPAGARNYPWYGQLWESAKVADTARGAK